MTHIPEPFSDTAQTGVFILPYALFVWDRLNPSKMPYRSWNKRMKIWRFVEELSGIPAESLQKVRDIRNTAVPGQKEADSPKLNKPSGPYSWANWSLQDPTCRLEGLLESVSVLNQARARYMDTGGENTGAKHCAAVDTLEGDGEKEARTSSRYTGELKASRKTRRHSSKHREHNGPSSCSSSSSSSRDVRDRNVAESAEKESEKYLVIPMFNRKRGTELAALVSLRRFNPFYHQFMSHLFFCLNCVNQYRT